MPNEPEELTHARVLLARFESEMQRPEGLFHLSKALLLLGDIRANSESENVRQVASNLPLAYAKKVQARVTPLLSPELPVHWETLEHWEEVFGEFESSDFALPQDIARTRLELQMKRTNKEIMLMSPGKRRKILEQLKAIQDK